jgi:hypothetical protein
VTKSYPNAEAFRQALDARVRNVARDRGVQIQGLQLKLAIERLLARLFAEADPPWLLKGGYAMELRFRPKARTTRDIDLTIGEGDDPAALRRRLLDTHDALRAAAGRDLGDFFEFIIQPARSELQGAPGGGGLYPVVARMAGREFARFHVDVGFGDAVVGETETLVGDDLLGFAGIGPALAKAIPKAQQFAEKVHAYTFPWTDRENTRSRDLVDLILLIERGDLDPAVVRRAVLETFRRRAKHGIPDRLPSPPKAWQNEYEAMAMETGVSTTELQQAFAALVEYWERLKPFR